MPRALVEQLPKAVAAWRKSDPRMAAQARKRPPLIVDKPAPSAFAALVTSLTHQQVSNAAGRAIYGRVAKACLGRPTPDRILALGPERLRSLGVSRQKARYILGVAERALDGRLPLRSLRSATDGAVIERLVECDGIGPWTAQMFLLFHLERRDVVAPDDWGLRLAAGELYGVSRKESRDFLRSQAAKWSPYGSLASLTLWRMRAPNP